MSDKAENHTNGGKGKEKGERNEGEEERENVMFALLVFILITLEKKLLDTGRVIFGSNVFKNPARYVIIVSRKEQKSNPNKFQGRHRQ